MKVIIASDIHGNLEYTRKLEKLIEKENPDRLILLGDIYYHGPRNSLPKEYNPIKVSEILNKYTDIIIAVRGNCDAEVDDMISNFNITADYKEIILDGTKFYITHGHLLDKLNNIIKDSYVFYGHTHVYDIANKKINPGSVGIPKVNSEHTVILYENKILTLLDLDDFKEIESKKI